MPGRLAGKVALISGAARGMGASEARLFACEGAKVVLGDVLEEQGRATVEDIIRQGGAATFVPLPESRHWPPARDSQPRSRLAPDRSAHSSP